MHGIDISLLHTLCLKGGATLEQVREAYLKLTTESKFQKVILGDEPLEREFKKYYEAYVNLIHDYEESGLSSDQGYYPPDKVAKFLFNSGIYHFIKGNYIKAGEKLQQAYQTNKQNVPLIIYL